MTLRVTLVLLLALSVAGCGAYYDFFDDRADREVERLRSEYYRKTLADRAEESKLPSEAEPIDEDDLPEFPLVGLPEALAIAVEHSRQYETEREALYLTGLDLTQQKNAFGPRLSSTLEAALNDGPNYLGQLTESASLGMTWITPTGGTFAVDGGVDSTRTRETPSDDDRGGPTDPSSSYNASVSFSLPLLAGAGYEATHEPLTQARRNLVYELRRFERFRSRFTIDVVSSYYDLVVAKRRVKNAEANLERFAFLRKRSEALFDADKATALDIFRSRQEELTAQNNLIREKQSVANALDRFKLQLGIPTAVDLDVTIVEPSFRPVDVNAESAVKAALANRLDLRIAVDEVADAERKARIAKQFLLPELTLDVDHDLSSLPGANVGHVRNDEGRTRVGASLDLPLDKTPERNAWQRSKIAVQRARRTLEERRDEIRNEVLRFLRDLNTAANTVTIQQQAREIAKKRLENARILFEIGSGPNRDVVEAQQALLNAQNAYIRALADYEVSRLQLLRSLDLLFIRSDGMWVEDVRELVGG